MRRWNHAVLILGLVLALVAGPIGLTTYQAVSAQTELLTNPGFEDPFQQEGSADIFVAHGWQAWYVVPDDVTYPTACGNNAPASCKPYHIPVYRNTQPQNPRVPPRARSGNSQQWGTSYATYVAGVYQQVGGLTAGTRLRFSAYTQGFNCDIDRGCFGDVGEYGKSYEPGDMQTRVGIDPTGGTNAFSPNVVWSSYINPLDAFVQQSVEAVAQGTSVTVFIWSWPTYPELHTDIYVDDASLMAVGQGEVATTAPTQAGTPAPTNTPGTPQPTQTIPPNTGTYTIQSGDTLSAIAARYNLTLDQLLALNPSLTRESILQVGQVINIGGTPQATAQPTATTAPTATSTPETAVTSIVIATAAPTLTLATSTPVANATPALAASGLCLGAFDDVNANGTRDANETSLAGVNFEVKDAGGQVVASYTSDSQAEPNCLGNLPDGRYTVNVTLPTGRVATTETRWSLSLLSGTTIKVLVGSQIPPAATAEPTTAPSAEPTAAPVAAETAGRSSSSSLALLIGGALVLLAVAALAFVLSARRRA